MHQIASMFVAASLIAAIFGPTTRAGGPELEIQDARVEKVVHDHRGVVLTVSGVVRVMTPLIEGDNPEGGFGKWVTLPMASGEIRYLGGELYALSADGRGEYVKRLKAMEGTEQRLQMWGTEAAIAGGHITRITARVVGVLLPRRGERRFDYERLEELSDSRADDGAVKLPQADTPAQDPPAIVVNIMRDGQLNVRGESIDADGLRDLFRKSPASRAVIRADARVPWKRVAEVLDVLREEAADVRFVARPPRDGE